MILNQCSLRINFFITLIFNLFFLNGPFYYIKPYFPDNNIWHMPSYAVDTTASGGSLGTYIYLISHWFQSDLPAKMSRRSELNQKMQKKRQKKRQKKKRGRGNFSSFQGTCFKLSRNVHRVIIYYFLKDCMTIFWFDCRQYAIS